ncbi:MAG: tetratricopeptide repeat protein, partial [Myxococcota bacterium]
RARRRRIGVLAVGGASILAAGSVVGARVTEHKAAAAVAPALCTGSEDAVAETWNDARRDRLREAFDATGLAYAPAVWASAAARIDGYAAQWVEARTQACQATRVTGEQSEAQLDRRMLCLDRRRGALDDLLHALSEPDDAAVERTIDAVRRLPAVEQCADAERLHDPTPLPDDEAQRAAVEDAMAVLGRIGAQVAVGHYATAKPMLKEVLQTAAEVDHLPLTLEARSWEADIEAASGAPAAAREALLAAYAAATALDDVAKQARLAGELAFEFGYRAADRDRGAMWLRLGRALVRRGGADEDQAAQLDSAEGSILVAAGDYGGAVTAHERALAYWNARAPESASAARVLDDLGAAEVQLGKVDEAIARHEAALQIRRRVYGERHPVVAASERELGMALSKAGRDEQALVPITHALQIHREARGEHNTHVAACLDDLGRIERRRGNLDAALAHHQAALPIWEALLGEEHPDVAVSLLGIGYTLVAAERPADAVPIQRRALRMFETTVGETHPYIVYAGNALGMALLQAGDPAGAIEPLTKALALRGKIETDPTLFADTLFALGKASYRTASSAAERSAGRDRVQAARDLFATQGDRWTSELAKIDAWLAQPNAAVADATP